MVGIVIVSHSAALAEGVRELADQMVQGKVPLAVAGGIDDPAQPIGTDAMKVLEAVNSIYSADGVVIFMDLGSALLSTELALEFLEPEQRDHVFLSSAPLVEGVMAAAVQASIGGTPQQVMAEANGSLLYKRDQLGAAPSSTDDVSGGDFQVNPLDAVELALIIPNKLGLHARPAALFVALAGAFLADIFVYMNDKQANAKSINQVAMLGAKQGDEIRIVAAGEDAVDALAALRDLAENNFGDVDELPLPDDDSPTPAARATKGVLTGIAASPGIAIGRARYYRPSLPTVEKYEIDDPESEWLRLTHAIDDAAKEIEQIKRRAVQQLGPSEAEIFEAHVLMLRDPELLQSARTILTSKRINAEAAWEETITTTAAGYQALDNTYMQARAADVRDVGLRVMRQLMVLESSTLEFSQPVILIAADLSPSDTAHLDPGQVLGICTELGGATSHSAILARGLGIPAVVGLGNALWTVDPDQMVVIDGTSGQLWVHPTESELSALQEKQIKWQQEQKKALLDSEQPAITTDGCSIEIAANIGTPSDIRLALEYGAEGVGLFRSEFLFFDRDAAPSEEEQYQAYRQAADDLGDRPLIIRTLDVGGDKPLPYLDLGPEDNPFLGWRGIRFCLEQPHIFKPQISAILRAGDGRNVKMMFPMIGTINELRRVKEIVGEVKNTLQQDQIPYDGEMDLGIMIEVPSAVAIADILAPEVNFFSIGTNDLTQYTMAADRGNSNVAALAQALNPAVLRLIDQTVRAGHDAGIWVGMCGELAGTALAAPLLVGLGLDELSMSAPLIPAVKNAIRHISMEDAQELTKTILKLDSAEAVTGFLESIQT